MQAALVHVFMLIFAAALARLGWFIAHNPERLAGQQRLGAKTKQKVTVGA